jgi:arylsulfatase A-like enzyme
MHITFSPARAALLFLVALTLLLALPLRAGTAHPDATRPNVVVVMMDDLDTSVWQTALDRRYLPNIQRHVIDRGTTFEQTFVSLSWCCPSRATYLTGQFPHNHGVIRGDGPYGGFKNFRDASTVATWLHDAGYRTGLVGKYLNGYKSYGYVPPGWDTWRALVAGGTSTYCMYGYTISMDGRYAHTYGTTDADYQTDVLAQMGVEFLQSTDPRPFFLTMTPVAPHYEDCAHDGEDSGTSIRPPARYVHTPPDKVPALSLPSFNEADMRDKPTWMRSLPLLDPKLEQDGYDSKVAAIRAVDDMVGRIAATLVAMGHYDDTMIMVTSDNGFQYGTHRRDGKINLYEESIRLPMVIHAPGQATPRSTSEWVMNNDWAPTIADMAGVTPGSQVDGRSLLPLVRGDAGATGRRTMLIELPPEYQPTRNNPPYYMIRSKDPALTLDHSGSLVLVYAQTLDPVSAVQTDLEFYDLAVDPLQMSSLHGDRSSTRLTQMANLRARLEPLKTCAGSGCRSLED